MTPPPAALLDAVKPVVDAVGATLVAPDEREASDVPLVWEGVVVAVVRMPPLHGALDRLIDAVEAELGGRLAELAREDKQRAVRLLDERGAFTLRRAVETVADAMGVSRITVYNYLNAIHRDVTCDTRFDVIGLDADDTLWHSEDSFHDVEAPLRRAGRAVRRRRRRRPRRAAGDRAGATCRSPATASRRSRCRWSRRRSPCREGRCRRP